MSNTLRKAQYLVQLANDTFIYVSADPDLFYESFRLYIGAGTTMREIPVESVTRYRDGGTTYVYTPEGIFFSPAPGHTDLVPHWGIEELIKLNPDDYSIVEEDGTVTITKK